MCSDDISVCVAVDCVSFILQINLLTLEHNFDMVCVSQAWYVSHEQINISLCPLLFLSDDECVQGPHLHDGSPPSFHCGGSGCHPCPH